MAIIRIRSKDGTFRVNVNDNDDFLVLFEEIAKKLKTKDPASIHLSEKPNEKGAPASTLCGRTISELGLKNGDMLTATFEAVEQGTVSVTEASSVETATKKPAVIQQLPIDDYLEKQDGLIKRPKSRICRHNDKGMCEYCSPLPPWDKDYMKEKGYKHLSFHSHLKELNEQKNNKNNATSYMHPLEVPNYNIDLNCRNGHAPYPRGICSKCQPPVITLQQQKFRMVDHVEFADFNLLNKFIDTWRQTGLQRFGILYGKYEPYEEVPLGIKAVVEAVYEPPQAGEADGITLLPWDDEQQVNEVAASLGLSMLGMVFTDLTDSGANNGTVLCKRHKDSYFLSCAEVIRAAKNQITHPNITKYAEGGTYSSKLVTCVISGGTDGSIEPRSYQVSVDTEALVQADIIIPSTHPSMLYINSSDDKRYVPDVFYSKINEYGLEVKTNAKPAFPVDFLLVTLSDSFPVDANPLFSSAFPIENRDFMGDLQNLSATYKFVNSGSQNGLAQLCDFHFIMYLKKTNILGDHEFTLLINCVKNRSETDYLQLLESPGWMSFITILEHSS